ncbi:hypothetical protein E2562_007836 [Oryza meyeriana var. granulata]|uniref:Uncharacterized protein n=1 Tax=Oryza meyeriana var. granulata TaxID=110450 RepID=A0A6G1F550_9ORYZ|nr:hypothetical protein E2562_007836 [Oryza meyeriana var. granulata]
MAARGDPRNCINVGTRKSNGTETALLSPSCCFPLAGRRRSTPATCSTPSRSKEAASDGGRRNATESGGGEVRGHQIGAR